MSGGQGITQELGISEIISKSFALYRKYIVSYLILFLVTEAVIGILTALVHAAVGGTTVSATGSLSVGLGSILAAAGLVLIISLVISPLAIGSAIRMTSDEITRGDGDLGPSVRYVLKKLPSIWAISIIVGIIVFLGLIAIVIPGIILAIMFSLAIPIVVIESPGVFASMRKSRKLVSGRWLRTFLLALVVGIGFIIASVIAGLIAGLFGSGSSIVSSILSGFYLPFLPIVLTVYYYSNVARITPQQPMPGTGMPAGPGMSASGTKFCPNCGTQLAANAMFCPNCGAKQST